MNQKNTPEKNNPFKSIGILSLLTFLSRIAGLIREVVKTYFLGVSFLSDAFNLAFSIPNLFRRLTAEGAMQSAFIPTLTEADNELGEQGRIDFVNSFFWWFTILLIIFSLLFIYFTPFLIANIFAAGFNIDVQTETIMLTRIMFVYIIFISLSAIIQSILNYHNIFWISAFTPILLNISIILSALFLSEYFENAAVAMSFGVVIGGVLQLFFQFPYALRLKYKFYQFKSLYHQYTKKTFQYFLPGIFGAGIYQLNIIVSSLIATTLETGSITALSISNRLIELILGVFIVSISTVILPKLSKLLVQDKTAEAKAMILQGLKLASYITLPVIAGLFYVGENVIEMLFRYGEFTQEDVQFTFYAFQFHIFGILFIAWNRILTASFYAKKWYKRNVKISLSVFIVNIIFCLSLIHSFSYAGIALANTFSQIFQTILMVIICHKYLHIQLFEQKLLLMFFKTLINIVLMLLALYLLDKFILFDGFNITIRTLILITFGVVTFIIGSYFMRIHELHELFKIFTRRQS